MRKIMLVQSDSFARFFSSNLPILITNKVSNIIKKSFMELSDEAKEMINRPKPKTKLIDLRTGKVVEE